MSVVQKVSDSKWFHLSRQSLTSNTKLFNRSDVSISLDKTKAFHGGSSLLISSTVKPSSVIYIPIFELQKGLYPDLRIEAMVEQLDPSSNFGLYVECELKIQKESERNVYIDNWDSHCLNITSFQSSTNVVVGLCMSPSSGFKTQSSAPLARLGALRVLRQEQTPLVAPSFQDSPSCITDVAKGNDGRIALTLQWTDEPLVEKWEIFRGDTWIGSAFCPLFQDSVPSVDGLAKDLFYRLEGYDCLGRHCEERKLALSLDL
jgi:hypothetical protein